jgi:hypothetical protein
MTTFKQYLSEEIAIFNDKIRITTQHDRAASMSNSISTYFKKVPLETSIPDCPAVVHSLLNYVSSEDSTNILKSLKGKGPYDVDQKQLASLMANAKTASAGLIKKLKPDVIIYPKSSSPLVKLFVDQLSTLAPNAKVLSDAFIKKALDAEDVEPLINKNHPQWEKFAKSSPKAVHELEMSLKRQIKNGELELKKLYKPHLKFIKNFIELKDAYTVLDTVLDKHVLVIDDILSSGSTMNEMVRQLVDLEPSKITGLTLFKVTTQPK